MERFVRYLARPPIAQGRLEWLQDGRLRYRFKRAWKDGSTAVDLEPFDLLARLCALVPPPVCPRCQGLTTWPEVATEPDAIDRAMADHGLAPAPHRARPPPLPLPHHAQLSLPL